jgi:hypothetical protein
MPASWWAAWVFLDMLLQLDAAAAVAQHLPAAGRNDIAALCPTAQHQMRDYFLSKVPLGVY